MFLRAPLGQLINRQRPINWGHPYAMGLIGFWKCVPGVSGGNTWYNLAAKANLDAAADRGDGTIVAATPTGSNALSPWGLNALSFNGSTAYVTCGNPANGAFDTDLSNHLGGLAVIADVFPLTATGERGIVCKANEDSNSAGSWDLFQNGANFGWIVYAGGARQISLTATGAVTQNTWQEIAGTWQPNAGSNSGVVYKNGQSLTQGGGAFAAIQSSTNNVTIGSAETNAGTQKYFFNGYIDNVRIYNVFIPPKTMEDIYQHAKLGFPGLLNFLPATTRPVFFVPAKAAATSTGWGPLLAQQRNRLVRAA
jgi:hypothetical protein